MDACSRQCININSAWALMELLGTTKIVERVDAAVEELDPKTHHAIGAAELVVSFCG